MLVVDVKTEWWNVSLSLFPIMHLVPWGAECVWCEAESSICSELCAVLMSSLVIRVHVVSRITLNAVQCCKLLLTVWMCVCAACCCCQTSDEQVVKPVVSVYPAASRAHLEGKSSLLCLASHMFPPLVRFSWKRRREDGSLEELPPAEGEQLELRESGRTAAILLMDGDPLSTYKYVCSVQHEGGTVEARTEQGNEGLVTVFSSDSASCGDAVKESRGAEDWHFSLQLQTFVSFCVSEVPAPAASCPPEREPADLPALQQADCKITCCLSAWTAPMLCCS